MAQRFIESERLFLRELRKEDAQGDYYQWLNDPEVYQYLETRYTPLSRENLEGFIKSMDGNRNEIAFAICLKDNDKHIGNIKLGPINWIHRFGDIGLLIGDKDQWGKGLASEAIGLVCRFGFDTLNLNKLKAGCYEDNMGSAKAFFKNGFEEEGRLKKQWFVNNRFQDNILMGLLREDHYKHLSEQ